MLSSRQMPVFARKLFYLYLYLGGSRLGTLSFDKMKMLDLCDNLIYFSFHKLECIVAQSRYEIVQNVWL